MKTKLLFFILLIGIIGYAQSDKDKAKMLYFSAEEEYNIENYSVCISKLNDIENLLGSTNSKVLELKTKAYFNNQNYVDAYISKSQFFDITTDEYPGYDNILRIALKIDEQAIPLIEQEGLQAFENKNYKKAEFCLGVTFKQKPDNLEIKEYYLKSLIALNTNAENTQKAKEALAFLQKEKEQKEFEEYQNALNNNSVENCDYYLNKYPSGKFITEVAEHKKQLIFQEDLKLVKASNSSDEMMDFLSKYAGVENEDTKMVRSLLKEKLNTEAIAIAFIGKLKKGVWKGKFGLINAQNKVIAELKYDRIEDFHEGLARVELNGKWGYINKEGKEITDIKYTATWNFHNGFAAVKSSAFGYINKDGEEIVKPIYRNVKVTAPVVLKEKWHLVNEKGEIISDGFYDVLGLFDGIALFKESLNGKWGYINDKGKIIVEPKFKMADGFSEGLAGGDIDDKWGYLNTNGEIAIDYKFEDGKKFKHGMAAIKLNGKWGFINKEGEIVIEPQYDYIGSISKNFCAVLKNKEWKTITKTGKVIETGMFLNQYVQPGFYEDILEVKRDGKYGYIDINEKEVIEAKYENIGEFTDGFAHVRLNGQYGIIDKTGKEITGIKYESIKILNALYAAVKLDKKWYILNLSSKEITPTEYNQVFTLEQIK